MAKISSFTLAAGMLGVAVLLKISAFAVAVPMLSGASPDYAGSFGRACTSAPQSKWLPIETLQSKVEALGYKVQQARLRSITTCGELYTIDKNGARVALFVDPTSGSIIDQL